MAENGEVIYSVSYGAIVALVIILAALLILLFFLYKHLNKEARGKYTVQRIVFRKGGLRDRARGAVHTLGNHLGVQLWPQSETAQDEENGEDEEEASSDGDESRHDGDDDTPQVSVEITGCMAEGNSAPGSLGNTSGESSGDSSDEEEEEAEANHEPLLKAEAEKEAEADDAQENKVEETKAPIVINLNQFSGSVLWSEEEKCEGGDVTAL